MERDYEYAMSRGCSCPNLHAVKYVTDRIAGLSCLFIGLVQVGLIYGEERHLEDERL